MAKIAAKYRDNSWDIARGLCILLMMVGHCANLYPWVYTSIESFHMPFFFIAAGYFFHEKPSKEVWGSSAKRLLIPLLIGACVCALITLLAGKPDEALDWLKALLFPGGTRRKVWFCPSWPCMGVFWFLTALFWCRILYNKLHKHLYGYWRVGICFGVSFFFAIASRRLTLPFGIGEGCCGLVFYAFGVLLKERDLLANTLSKWYLLLFVSLWIFETQFVEFRMYQFGYDYFYPIAVCFACGMGYVLISVVRMVNSARMQGRVIRLLGYYSLEAMCCHQVVRTIIDSFELRETYSTGIVNSLLLIGSIILTIFYIGLKNIAKTIICKNS